MEDSYQNLQIDIDRPHELWDWADKFKVSAEELKQAVLVVGSSAEKVQSFLKK